MRIIHEDDSVSWEYCFEVLKYSIAYDSLIIWISVYILV